ncbi:MAG: energy transducer TonB [Spirosomataceae bacterium]
MKKIVSLFLFLFASIVSIAQVNKVVKTPEISSNIPNKSVLPVVESVKDSKKTTEENDSNEASEEELQTMQKLIDDAKTKLNTSKSEVDKATVPSMNYEKVGGTTSNMTNLNYINSEMPLSEEERKMLGIDGTNKVKIVSDDDIEQDSIYVVTETEPQFVGGQGALEIYIAQKLDYAKNATLKGVMESVYVRFLVTKEGKVKKVHIARGVYGELDREAIKVVRQMPDWIPATVDKKPVSSFYILPINVASN